MADDADAAGEAAASESLPLSIPTASLIRSIDALSLIFWISIGGTILTVLFAGLNQLASNEAADSIYIGEYQVPKSILPLASLAFATFVFWMTSNRLRMLHHVLSESHLPDRTLHAVFTLNPPILDIFHPDNHRQFKLGTGSSVLLINWSIFFGNSIAFTLLSAVQRGASIAEFDFPELALFGIATIGVIFYGVRAIDGPLDLILERLHGSSFNFGWFRISIAIAVMATVAAVNNFDQFRDPSSQPDGLLGPAFANAIDGETLFIGDVELQLIGIDAMEPEQTCLDRSGAEYPCGRDATRALQALVAERPIICLPLFAVSSSRIVGSCNLLPDGAKLPSGRDEFMAADRHNSLSGRMVREGNALAIGLGRRYLESEQRTAQQQRLGVWQGAFEPPWTYRARQR